MPRTQEENERIRQQTKAKIRDAAMELFMRKGYHATSIDDVSKHAGVSKGLLYNYYKGKEELLGTMVEARIEELIQVMEKAEALETPAEQLRHIVEGAIENVQRFPEVFRFYLHLQTQPEADEAVAQHGKLLVEESARQFQIQCRMFGKLGAADPVARSLYFSSALQGIMLMISTYPDEFPVEAMKRQIVVDFCQG
ncbi:TetR/AcrR family transcriptional regulator [Paenibacillus sp. XY044]|uniref:TetR/AcrR family transcriptional regulator n=1 Tax=Paenibacillus sp. XY044 TaxID=2026089 RepID=UPI000B9951B3|nr:TetR/AcrR family transcriptional regulator [Paenibacillus sp. XY044]OZB98675.1 TetR family transcriptional regulator [Paenibacillus sp. XY044]